MDVCIYVDDKIVAPVVTLKDCAFYGNLDGQGARWGMPQRDLQGPPL
ncbi:hypothetical protein ACFVVX_15210 [Kitasatospora sp. NPDC058170]